jgi:Zn-dependent peptidase ImmA (M78 family)
MKITLQPFVLQWARQRARLGVEALAVKFSKKDAEKWVGKIEQWEKEGKLTYSEAEKLAHLTHTAFGYLFLDKPPVEKLPIPDFRTAGSQSVEGMSMELLDVIYQSQRRQDWFRDHLRETESDKPDFVGSFPPGKPISKAAESIRKHLAYHPSQCRESSLDAVIREFVDAAEAAGILVVRAGKVGNNTRRTLDPQEFRGFALVDEWAPLVFVNSADTKAAQIFTLAHELAHIWAGQSAISNLEKTYAPEQRVEVYCNAVAAEYLVPMEDLISRIDGVPAVDADFVRTLRLHYRVSDLVIIRRLHDAGAISKAAFKRNYNDKLEEYRSKPNSNSGNFHNNQPGQIGRRFGTAVVASTLEGKTLYRDALSLLDMKRESSFKEFARNLNFPL